MLPALNPSEIGRLLRIAVGVAGLLLLGACACPARAGEMPTAGPEAEASRLVEEVLRKAGDGDLGEWTRSAMSRALERAGETARQITPGQPGSAAPLPAERHAAGIAEGRITRNGAAEILIFTSLSVPAASWRQWVHDAARTGAPLVLRGVGAGGLTETARRIGARLGSHAAGPGSKSGASVAIDPRLFRLFGIERVPAVVVVPGGVPPCESRGCSDDLPPPHDLIAGNIGLVAALEAVAAEGDVGREVSEAYLERLREGSRP